MEIFAIADPVTVETTHGLGFSNSLLRRHFCTSSNRISVQSNLSSEPSYPAIGVLSISAGIMPVDAIAPPAVRSNSCRAAPRTLVRRKRRTRKRSLRGDSDDGDQEGFFGDGDGGPFGGGGMSGGGGGGEWNFDKYGGESNWEGSSPSFSDPAFVFFYEVVSWIALSNCLHFAVKKVVRFVADGIEDPSREKVPIRFLPIC